MRAAWVAVACVLLSGCGTRGGAVPAQPGVVNTSLVQVEKGGVPTLTEERQVLAYARAAMAELTPSITFRLEGGDTYNRAYTLANVLLRDGVAVSFSICTRGSEVILQPNYADNEVMLYAYRHPSAQARLTSDQRRALSLARNVVNRVCAEYSSDYERALALHDYIVLNGTYTSEMHGQDSANATARLLLTGKGVCDAYTRAYRLMLSMAGIENIFVAGEAQRDNHCWNLVRLQGRWVHVDCTYSDPKPDEPGRVFHTHFALPDALLATDHQWDRSKYPAAVTSALYYPFRYASFATVEQLVVWCREHRMEVGSQYVTAYVEEVRNLDNNQYVTHRLFEAAHTDLGVHVVAAFALEENLPGVIVCRCKVND